MPFDNMFRPTLLVGVGGTGCRIAERIYAKANQTQVGDTGKIKVIGFDTDENDMLALKAIGPRERIQFSTPETIFRILDRNPDVEKSWFPERTELPSESLGMTLVEGAAQIRLFTRLALTDAFAHRMLMSQIEDAVGSLGVHDATDNYSGSIHILMVGSLAGATGSGSFITLALALKRAAKARGISASVRGLFLLPDVYVRGGTLPADQIPNVLANGYASLKELNAVNVLVSRPERNARFEFEFLPGMSVRRDELPFEVMTLIDYETMKGGNMGRTIDNYVEMAVRAGYLLVFTPLGARYGSITINDARATLAKAADGTHGLYSGIGVSSVTYPVESMKQYLIKRLVTENLRGDWTRLGRQYLDKVRRFKQLQTEGAASLEEPLIDNSFIDDLEQLGRQENIAFFRRIHDSLYPVVEDPDSGEREIKPRHELFLSAMIEHVRNSFWASERVAEARDRGSITTETLKVKDKLADTVRDAENRLDRDFRQIETALQHGPEDIFANAWRSADDINERDWQSHHIQSHIVQDGPHPVQVRVFLYLLRREIRNRMDIVDPKRQRENLFGLATQYRDEDERKRGKSTERGTRLVIDQAEEAAKSGIFGMFASKAEEFSKKYSGYFNNSLRSMRVYADTAIEAKVLEAAYKEVDGLIRVFAGLFSEVEDTMIKLERDMDREENLYAKSAASDGNVWVYANKPAKEDAWSRLSDKAAGIRLDEAVNKNINQSVFNKYRSDRLQNRESGFRELNDLFRTEVIERFGRTAVEQDYSSVYDISVVEALKRDVEIEADEARRDSSSTNNGNSQKERVSENELNDLFRSRLQRAVDTSATQSEPYVTLDNPDRGEAIKFWTINPIIQEDIADNDLFQELFVFKQGDNPIVEAVFDKYQLNCLTFRVNLELANLAKLNPGEEDGGSIHATEQGRMYNEYEKLVKNIISTARSGSGVRGNITPHIDKRWHQKGFLPEIFQELEVAVRTDISKSFVVAFTHGLIVQETAYGQPLVRFATIGKGMGMTEEEELDSNADLFEVFKDYRDRSHLTNAAMDFWNKSRAEAASKFEAQRSAKALLDADRIADLMMISATRSDSEERDQTTTNNISAWITLVGELLDVQRTDLDPKGRMIVKRELVDRLQEDIFIKIGGRGVAPEVMRVLKTEFGRAYDSAFS